MNINQLLISAIVSLLPLTAKAIDSTSNPNLNKIIKPTDKCVSRAMIDNKGNFSESNCDSCEDKEYGQHHYGIKNNNSFAIDYGEKNGIITGQSLCSTHAGTDLAPTNGESYRIIKGNIFPELSDSTGEKGAEFCYCRLNGYISPDGTFKKLYAPLLLASYGGAFLEDGAEEACADYCTIHCLGELQSNYGFRSALFMLDNINDWIKCDYEPDKNKSNIFNLNTKICRTAGIDYGFTGNNGELYSGASELGLTKNDKNAFAIDYGNKGILRGTSKCSSQYSTNTQEKISDEKGQYCYCQLSSYTLNDSTKLLSSSWLFHDHLKNGPNGYVKCDFGCASSCGKILQNNDPASISFRSAIFNTTKIISSNPK